MITIVIDGPPVPWAAHQGYGRRAYNPKQKQKDQYRWQIKHQYNQSAPISTPVKIAFVFHMAIPKSTSSIRKRQMLNGMIQHMTRPDATNLQKFVEDTLKGIVIEDDGQVVEITSKKIYGEHPKTVIMISEIQ